MRKVFTYYQPVSGIHIEDTTRLLLLWRENWSDMGYEPIVLNEYIARLHPKFDKFNERIKQFPSINPPEYERACYLRYLAVAHMGGGIMCDYDVFCYGDLDLPKKYTSLLMSYQRHVPSFVFGNAQAFNRMVEFICSYQLTVKDISDSGVPHVSDMYMLLRGVEAPYEAKHVVKNFGDTDWDKSPLVHYANGSMAAHKPRWKNIQQLRNWK